MSKIQDAIRKLQSPGQSRLRKRSQKDTGTQTLATIARAGEKISGEDSVYQHAVVTVDYDSLRENGLLAPDVQQRQIADQYRIIKRPLLDNITGRHAHQAADANLIMVASPLTGDGKTFNCINLALSMATEKDRSVLLVDADVAKPHISELFGLQDEPGLIDLLIDGDRDVEELILATNVPGLDLLPAGRRDEHATELLASNRMAKVANDLSTRFSDRVVIFDSPPLLMTSEARVLASRMGQIVLVVCAGVTPQQAVVEAVESLDDEKAISTVLNRSSYGFGSGGYGGYGGYGYGSVSTAQKES